MNKPFFKIEKDLFGNKLKDKNYVEISEYTKVEFNNHNYQFDNLISIDIETTGLKSHKQGHEIICIAITDKNKTIVFNEFNDKLFDILKDKNIKKIIQNAKFELSWIKNIWGFWIENVYWDTMLATHIIDNTAKCGLKEQVKINFDIEDYDINIKKYLKAENSNDFNNIENADINEIMIYCGYDSYFTYKLYELQKEKLKDRGYDLFMQGMLSLSRIEQNGINIDTIYLNQLKLDLENKLKKLNHEIQYDKKVTANWNGHFNFNSTKDMNDLLFNKLKIKPIKITKKGNNSCDKEVLNQLNLSFVKKILEYKKYEKLKNTYLLGIEKEICNEKIYPQFHLHTVSSYRSSASNPNIQNFPKRDEETKMIRKLFKPSKDNYLLEIDYGQLEVRIGACYHQDPVMINYILDDKSDMHLDTACDLFLISRENVSKELRYLAKNKFVFPQFYGDYYLNCANNIMKEIDVNNFGFTKQKFINHVQDVENQFWNIRFKNYTKWKNYIWEFYQKRGFIPLKTGFRCIGKMDKKQCTNIQIQGSAFHCLLWSLIQVQKFIETNNLKSKIIAEIHDSLIIDFDMNEKDILIPEIKKIMTKDIIDNWNWIIVPLEVSIDISEQNENWSNMKEFKI